MISKTATSSKILFIIRHGKAEAHRSNDKDRCLQPRALFDLEKTCKPLLEFNEPDLILCSSSRRTTETLDCIRTIHQKPYTAVTVSDDLYLADCKRLKSCIASQAEHLSCIWIIGHNPGLSDLYNLYLQTKPIVHIPTSGIAGLNWKNTAWCAISEQAGNALYWKTPH